MKVGKYVSNPENKIITMPRDDKYELTNKPQKISDNIRKVYTKDLLKNKRASKGYPNLP